MPKVTQIINWKLRDKMGKNRGNLRILHKMGKISSNLSVITININELNSLIYCMEKENLAIGY